ncbi:VOC family protein [Actinotalea sp. K2]|uniref:VOC family protein n=1 Tax=Actinotalea sp. K2 TaxID=2939438 RepID=UPI002017AA3D|nr:VOC family protein [Actinotalea sp. K2]MCL3861986.1 VOC family protein [Actinotalea sp. K2]
MTSRGTLHHLELWVADLEAARPSLEWLLVALGYRLADSWSTGLSWELGATYVVVESGPDVRGEHHDRRAPGLNHVAFHAGSRADVEDLAREAQSQGWSLLFEDRHPYAGGRDHYAAYLENATGFEVELVASPAEP